MKYLVEYKSYTDKEVIKGLKKSIKNGLIKTDDVDKTVGDIMGMIVSPEVGTFEYFIDSDFTSIADMDRLLSYLDKIEKEYSVDVSKARKYYPSYVRYEDIEQKLEQDNFNNYNNGGDEDRENLLSNEEKESLYDEQNKLSIDIDMLKKEILNIKKMVRKKRES